MSDLYSTHFPALHRRRRGASLTGYGLVVGLIAVIAIISVQDVGGAVSTLFGEVGNEMDTVSGGASGGSSSNGGEGVNQPPEAATLSANILAEDSGAAALVGILSAIDPDAGQTVGFTLGSAGGDESFFQIANGNELQAVADFDFDTPQDTGGTAGDNIYLIEIIATDNGTPSENSDATLSVIILDDETILTASDGAAGDNFGYDVSLSGSMALIGALGDDDDGSLSGSAYLFNCSGSACSQSYKLTASDAAENDYFGWSVSLSGSQALVGAPNDDDNGSNSGSVYLFDCSGGTCSQNDKLTASDGVGNDEFGYDISLSGSMALVGAHGDDSSSGSAYLFDCSGGTCSQSDKLTASDGAANDLFGYALSLSGNLALVGAYGDDDNGSSSGSAYLFNCSGITCSQSDKLTASDGAANDYFGRSITLSGNLALVGAYANDDNGSSSGSAYLFDCSGGTCSESMKLTASDAAFDDSFGNSVSLSGNQALIGAHGDDGASGSAYLFDCSGGTCNELDKLSASDGAGYDRFGRSVSLSGSLALVGSYQVAGSRGSAYLFPVAP